MLKDLANGDYFFYKLSEGGCGIVKADSPEDAERKVRDGYTKHSSYGGEDIEIYDIYQKPFDDAPDVIEIFEY